MMLLRSSIKTAMAGAAFYRFGLPELMNRQKMVMQSFLYGLCVLHPEQPISKSSARQFSSVIGVAEKHNHNAPLQSHHPVRLFGHPYACVWLPEGNATP